MSTFDPDTATPEQVEELIDMRVARFDEEISNLMAHVEDLRAKRKRWLGVTGGRSRSSIGGDDGQPLLTLTREQPSEAVEPVGRR